MGRVEEFVLYYPVRDEKRLLSTEKKKNRFGQSCIEIRRDLNVKRL